MSAFAREGTVTWTARSAIADALDILHHLTTDDFANGKDRPARELLVEAIVTLGGNPVDWDDYPEAVARGSEYARRPLAIHGS